MLRVYDDTPWVRDDPYAQLSESVGPWQVTVEGECTTSVEEILEACNCNTSPRPAAAAWILGLALLIRRRRG